MQLTVRSWRFPDLSSRSIAVCFEAAVALHELAEMGTKQSLWGDRPTFAPRACRTQTSLQRRRRLSRSLLQSAATEPGSKRMQATALGGGFWTWFGRRGIQVPQPAFSEPRLSSTFFASWVVSSATCTNKASKSHAAEPVGAGGHDRREFQSAESLSVR